MWLMVMFDLPVQTKQNRRDYRRFVDKLVDDSFTRIQFSVYVRPCAEEENAVVHQKRLEDWLPPEGEIRILKFTDKQWGRMLTFRHRSLAANEKMPKQFAFFDAYGEVIIEDDVGQSLLEQETIEDIDPNLGNLPPAEPLTKPLVPPQTGPEKKLKKKRIHSEPQFDFFDGGNESSE